MLILLCIAICSCKVSKHQNELCSKVKLDALFFNQNLDKIVATKGSECCMVYLEPLPLCITV